LINDHSTLLGRLENWPLTKHFGYVRRVAANAVEADGPDATIGTICNIQCADMDGGSSTHRAEIIKVTEDRITLVPYDQMPVRLNAKVTAIRHNDALLSTDSYNGRAINALGEPIDGLGTLVDNGIAETDAPYLAAEPFQKTFVEKPLLTGIRAIDTMMTLSTGQRIGIFAPAGTGKTTIVEQLSSQVEADHIIICLVGERGHEVNNIWRLCQSFPDDRNYTLVASTSDESAGLRARAPEMATRLAEKLRAQGKHVVLLFDSMTRYAMALREIGLASGEPPTLRAYTPNVFAQIPKIVERCGALDNSGSISLIATVLAESEDVDDPICEVLKSVLDGHILLSRRLAEKGQFPAIDVGRSMSRNADRLIDDEQARAVGLLRKNISTYEESRTLIESGVYQAGTNQPLDEAIALYDRLSSFISQKRDENVGFEHARQQLFEMVRRRQNDEAT